MKTPEKRDLHEQGSASAAATEGTSGAILNAKGKNREELEALEVAEDSREKDWGLPSFLGELFMGTVRAKSLESVRLQEAADRRIGDELVARVDRFLKEKLDAEAVDRTGEIPAEAMQEMARLGLFGMKIPKEYGGLGLSQTNYMRVLARVCAHCGSTAAMLSAHQSIGVPQPLKYFGTEAQKKKYLPQIAAGKVSAFALTEPAVGSDPAQMSTTATPTGDGQAYVINGTKLWCTNGAIADVLVVMARTPSKFVNGKEKKQITAFIVEKGTPGFKVLHRSRFMGLNGIQNALLGFENVRVPKENILWGEGKGLRLALTTLNAGRLSIPATCVGGLRDGLRESRKWGLERVQWGAPIGRHEAGSSKIADTAAHLFAMEAMSVTGSVWVDDESHDIRLEAAMAKLFCSEHAWRLSDQFVQLRGGRGYERESSLKARGEEPIGAERALRDARINRIVEGTTEILTLFIAREALDKHLKVAGDVLNPKLPLGRRAGAALKAGAFYGVWYPTLWIRSLLASLKGLFSGGLAREQAWAEAKTARLARTLFHLMLLNGPKLEKRQLQLMRTVNIASDLFAMLTTIAYARVLRGKSFVKDAVFAGSAGGPEAEVNAELAALTFCRIARLRIIDGFRSLSRNADSEMRALSKQILG